MGKSFGRRVMRSIRRRSERQLFWWRGPPFNFGDWIGPYLFERLSDSSPQYTVPSNKSFKTVFVTVGSLARWFCEDSIVWGSGIIERREKFWQPHETLAVRGPYSRERFLELGYECPEIYGDPAILLPLFFRPQRKIRYRVGIVSHYGTAAEVRSDFGNRADIAVIDASQPVETVVRDICSCARVVSSSLHGLIVSHAYGVPAAWAEFSRSPGGDGTKFLDYFASAKIFDSLPFALPAAIPIDDLEALVDGSVQPDLEFLRLPLLQACPFRRVDAPWPDGTAV